MSSPFRGAPPSSKNPFVDSELALIAAASTRFQKKKKASADPFTASSFQTVTSGAGGADGPRQGHHVSATAAATPSRPGPSAAAGAASASAGAGPSFLDPARSLEASARLLNSVPVSLIESELGSLLRGQQMSSFGGASATRSSVKPGLAAAGSASAGATGAPTRAAQLDALKNDELQLADLRAQLETSEQAASSVASIFDQFDVRLSDLESTLKPLHERTNRLKTVHANVDAAMGALQSVLDIFNTAQEVEGLIKDGPRGQPAQYIAAMDRVEAARAYLARHENYKSSAKVVKHLDALEEIALREAESALVSGIRKYGGVINVDQLVASLQQAPAPARGKAIPGSNAPAGVANAREPAESCMPVSGGIKKAGKLPKPGSKRASKRSSAASKAGRGRRSGSAAAAASAAGGSQSDVAVSAAPLHADDDAPKSIPASDTADPSPGFVLIEPSRVLELQSWVVRLRRNERVAERYEAEYVRSRGQRVRDALLKLLRDQRYDKTARFASLLRAFVRLLEAERDLARELISGGQDPVVLLSTGADAGGRDDDNEVTTAAAGDHGDRWRSVFASLIMPAVTLLTESAESKMKQAKSAEGKSSGGGRSQFSPALFVILDVWHAFGPASPTLTEQLTEFASVGPGKLTSTLSQFVAMVKDEAQKALSEFESAVVKHPIKGPLPPDGTVHALASNTLNFLKRLHDLREVLVTVLPDPGGGADDHRRRSVGSRRKLSSVAQRSGMSLYASSGSSSESGEAEVGKSLPAVGGKHLSKKPPSPKRSGSGSGGRSKKKGGSKRGASKRTAVAKATSLLAVAAAAATVGVDDEGSDEDSEEETRLRVLGTFYVRIIELLRENLEAKARKREKRGDPLATLFLLNNYNYIIKVVKGSPLIRSVVAVHPRFKREIEELVEGQMALYRDAWQRAVDALLSKDLPPASAKYTKKERWIVKSIFEQFNKEIGDLSASHRSYSIPDVKLRKKVRALTKANLLPEYQRFYQAYARTPFTTNYEKYLRYTPESLDRVLDSFFEITKTVGAPGATLTALGTTAAVAVTTSATKRLFSLARRK